MGNAKLIALRVIGWRQLCAARRSRAARSAPRLGGAASTGPTIAKLLKFCYRYDTDARTYTMNITRVSGIAVVLMAVLFVVVFILRPRKKTAER